MTQVTVTDAKEVLVVEYSEVQRGVPGGPQPGGPVPGLPDPGRRRGTARRGGRVGGPVDPGVPRGPRSADDRRRRERGLDADGAGSLRRSVRRADPGARGRPRRRALGRRHRRDPRTRWRGAGLVGAVPGGTSGTDRTAGQAGPTRAVPGSATRTSTMCTTWSVRCRSSTSTAACWRWCRSASAIRRSGNCFSGAGERLLIYLGLGAALGLLASWLLSRRIKRHTRGLEVAEIAGLADHREALLHSIREGVVGVGNDGEITVLNDSARSCSTSPTAQSVAASTTSVSTPRWPTSCSPAKTETATRTPDG